MRRMQSGRQRELQDEGCRTVVRENYGIRSAVNESEKGGMDFGLNLIGPVCVSEILGS